MIFETHEKAEKFIKDLMDSLTPIHEEIDAIDEITDDQIILSEVHNAINTALTTHEPLDVSKIAKEAIVRDKILAKIYIIIEDALNLYEEE